MPGPLARLILTSGEPAGIGPDLCLKLATREIAASLVVAGDPLLLEQRARALGLDLRLEAYTPGHHPPHRPGTLMVAAYPVLAPISAGKPDPANAGYVLDMLRAAAQACMQGEFDAMVTAPVHKGVINEAGQFFSGHTEFLADLTGARGPVMLLVAGTLRVALATTHLPLARVSESLDGDRLIGIARTLDRGLREWFGIAAPRIAVCGLNPHAGEGGHLGREEIDIIEPALKALRQEGIEVSGPWPADTVFTPPRLADTDAVLAMYHDQGLPVLKHAGFGSAVNVTLGLPILRTSVDHGTALELAATGRADSGSLEAAVDLTLEILSRGSE